MGRTKARIALGGVVMAIALMAVSPASGLVGGDQAAKADGSFMSGAGFIDLRPGPHQDFTARQSNGKAHHNFKLYCPPEEPSLPDARNHLRLHGNVAGNYQFTADVINVTDCEDINEDGRPDRIEGNAEGTCNGVIGSTVPHFEFTDNAGPGPIIVDGPGAEVSSSRMSVPLPGETEPPPPEDQVFYDLVSGDAACDAAAAGGPIDGGSHKGHKG